MSEKTCWLESALRSVFQFLLDSRMVRVAVVFWVLYAGILAIVVAVNPDRRTVTPNYRQAAEKWWEGKEDIYFAKKKGYLYMPQSAWVYTPFVIPPKRVGEALWRVVSLGLLAWALWRAAQVFRVPGGANPFALLTAVVVPSSFASAGNGQMNIPLAAVFLLVAVALARERYVQAAVLLTVSLALKPPAIVLVLLAGAVIPALWLPLGLSLLVLAALPFVHFDPSYVVSQYQLFAKVLVSASAPTIHDYCDVAGMFRTFGWVWSDRFGMAVRLVAAIFTLGVAWVGWRRWSGGAVQHAGLWAGFWVVILAATYLMLFNPRTEANTYIVLSPLVAVLLLRVWAWQNRWRAAAALTGYLILLGCDSYGPLHGMTNLWLKALMTCGLAVFLVREIFSSAQVSSATRDT